MGMLAGGLRRRHRSQQRCEFDDNGALIIDIHVSERGNRRRTKEPDDLVVDVWHAAAPIDRPRSVVRSRTSKPAGQYRHPRVTVWTARYPRASPAKRSDRLDASHERVSQQRTATRRRASGCRRRASGPSIVPPVQHQHRSTGSQIELL